MSEASYEPQSDEDTQVLIQRLQAGHVDAFERLFEQFSPQIYRQAMHFLGNEAEAEEVMQEVFLILYEKANTFRGDAAVSTWLYRLSQHRHQPTATPFKATRSLPRWVFATI